MKAFELSYSCNHGVLQLNDNCSIPENNEQLLIKVMAAAINRTDLVSIKTGTLPKGNNILGVEVSGIVVDSGKYSDIFPKGTRVMGLVNGGGYAEYVSMHGNAAIKIPDYMNFQQAAGIPEVFLTAYQTLFGLGYLKNDETVLVHAGASGVGTAAIQLAKQLTSAKIITTAGSDKKLALCRSLGADVLINYHENDFSEVVKKETAGSGVDVILDFIGSSYWNKNISSIAYDGRWVLIGILGGSIVEKVNLMNLMEKRISLKGTLLTPRSDDYKARLTKEFIQRTKSLFDEKKLNPIIDKVFSFEDVEKAHGYMQSNAGFGKTILNIGASE